MGGVHLLICLRESSEKLECYTMALLGRFVSNTNGFGGCEKGCCYESLRFRHDAILLGCFTQMIS